MPRWRRDGREIFYLALDFSAIRAAQVNATGATFTAGTDGSLFPARIAGGNWPYDVSADGQRFLINAQHEQSTSTPLSVVVNWTALLKE